MADDTKPVALFWDFYELAIAILMTAAIASVIIWRLPLHAYFNCPGSSVMLMSVSMSQLAAALAGLWGYQAVHKSRRATDKSKWIQASLYINFATCFCCFFGMLPIIIFMYLALFGSLLFFLLVFITTVTAFIIRGRFFLHLITVYFLLTAHLLFWRYAMRIAESA